jgi:hypothetical protein
MVLNRVSVHIQVEATASEYDVCQVTVHFEVGLALSIPRSSLFFLHLHLHLLHMGAMTSHTGQGCLSGKIITYFPATPVIPLSSEEHELAK